MIAVSEPSTGEEEQQLVEGNEGEEALREEEVATPYRTLPTSPPSSRSSDSPDADRMDLDGDITSAGGSHAVESTTLRSMSRDTGDLTPCKEAEREQEEGDDMDEVDLEQYRRPSDFVRPLEEEAEEQRTTGLTNARASLDMDSTWNLISAYQLSKRIMALKDELLCKSKEVSGGKGGSWTLLPTPALPIAQAAARGARCSGGGAGSIAGPDRGAGATGEGGQREPRTAAEEVHAALLLQEAVVLGGWGA
jgi:hypothetical protein